EAEAKRKAAEAEQQRFQEEVQRQAKVAADAEAKRKATEAEQQPPSSGVQCLKPDGTPEPCESRRVTDPEVNRKAAEAGQQRPSSGVQCWKPDGTSEPCESRRVTDPVPVLPGRPVPAVTELFTVRSGAYAYGAPICQSTLLSSVDKCEQRCARVAMCKVFAYSNRTDVCRLHTSVDGFS